MILVTGHTGFVGTAFTARLMKKGIRHVGISRATGHDLTQPGSMNKFTSLSGPASWIVHLAGKVEVPPSWQDPESYYRTNLASAVSVAEQARKTGASILLLSSYIYGTPQYLPVDESHPVMPSNPYAHSKALSEQILIGFARDFGVPIVILRVFNLFGTGQPESQLISQIVSQALEGATISVRDLTPKRDYLWIDDLVSALLMITDRPGEGCEIYNVGSGISHSVQEIIDSVTSVVGSRQIICSEDVRPNEIPDCVSDSGKLTAQFGWRPRTSLASGITRLLAAAKAH